MRHNAQFFLYYNFCMKQSCTAEDIKYFVPDNVATGKIADFFSLFSDNTRLRLLCALSISKLCVTDLADLLNLNQTTVSHQLRILKGAKAVSCERDGKMLYYKLENTKINDILLIGVEFLGY